MTAEQWLQTAGGLILALVSGIQVYVLREILSLRRSKHLHANVLQRHIGRFARIGERLGIEWDDVEADIMKG